jgi:membrane fusion protein, multidrug efflux system
MSNNNGTQVVDDERQAITVADHEAFGSQSAKTLGKHSTTRRKRVVMISAAVAFTAACTYFVWNAFHYEDTDSAEVQADVMPLSARINGQIKDVYVSEGQLVHAGEVLVTIDPQDYRIAQELAQADLADALLTAASSHWNVAITSAAARSYLVSAKTAVVSAEDALKAAEQNHESAEVTLVQAEANAAKSEADLERHKQLVAKEEISRQQYEHMVATATANRFAVIAAEAGVRDAEQSVQQAQEQLLRAKNDLQTAETAPQRISLFQTNAQAADAEVSRRHLQLAQAELNVSYTVICSPVTGIVGKRSVGTGQNVNIGQELIDVVPVDDLWVTANFKETQLAHMHSGQPVEIKVDAYGRKWNGHVTNLGGGTVSALRSLPPEKATGNYAKVVQRVPVRIDFDRPAGQKFNAEGLLKPGLSVEPKVRVR